MEQHEGFIHFESKVDQGARFCIYFPATTEAPEEIKVQTKKAIEVGKETILVVEDEEPVRDLIKEVLTMKGYKVITAINGLQALELYKKMGADIDLILLDVMMPEMGGEEAMQKIQLLNKSVKIIFVTAYSENSLHTDFLSNQNLNLVGKPFLSDTLLKTVRQVLDEHTIH